MVLLENMAAPPTGTVAVSAPVDAEVVAAAPGSPFIPAQAVSEAAQAQAAAAVRIRFI